MRVELFTNQLQFAFGGFGRGLNLLGKAHLPTDIFLHLFACYVGMERSDNHFACVVGKAEYAQIRNYCFGSASANVEFSARIAAFLKKADTKGVYALGVKMQVWLYVPLTPEVKEVVRADAKKLVALMQTDGEAKGFYNYTDAGRETTYSHSRAQPFARLKVKLKQEIIAFRREHASPLLQRAPSVTPFSSS